MTSWVWDYFEKDDAGHVTCKQCKDNNKVTVLKFHGSTSTLGSHLRSQHNLEGKRPGVTLIPFGLFTYLFFYVASTPITALFARKAVAAAASAQLSPRENICVLWAVRALPYDLIDDPLFRIMAGFSGPGN